MNGAVLSTGGPLRGLRGDVAFQCLVTRQKPASISPCVWYIAPCGSGSGTIGSTKLVDECTTSFCSCRG